MPLLKIGLGEGSDPSPKATTRVQNLFCMHLSKLLLDNHAFSSAYVDVLSQRKPEHCPVFLVSAVSCTHCLIPPFGREFKKA